MGLSHEALRGRSAWIRGCAGILLGGLFVYLVLVSVDVAAVAGVLWTLAWPPILLGLGAYAVAFLLRAWRFWLLLGAREADVELGPMIPPFIASFGISDILPLRAGDLFRILWFRKRFALPVGTILAASMLERMLELVGLIGLGVLVLALVDFSADPVLLDAALGLFALTFAACMALLASPRLLGLIAHRLDDSASAHARRLSAVISSLAGALARSGNPLSLIGLFLLSLLIWLLESLVILSAWISLGGSALAIAQPFIAFVGSTLGTLVPGLPGHFGSYEYFGLLAFDSVGADRTLGAATLLVAHLMLWFPTAAFAVIWMLHIPRADRRLTPAAR